MQEKVVKLGRGSTRCHHLPGFCGGYAALGQRPGQKK